jgi:hypothetical protein
MLVFFHALVRIDTPQRAIRQGARVAVHKTKATYRLASSHAGGGRPGVARHRGGWEAGRNVAGGRNPSLLFKALDCRKDSPWHMDANSIDGCSSSTQATTDGGEIYGLGRGTFAFAAANMLCFD